MAGRAQVWLIRSCACVVLTPAATTPHNGDPALLADEATRALPCLALARALPCPALWLLRPSSLAALVPAPAGACGQEACLCSRCWTPSGRWWWGERTLSCARCRWGTLVAGHARHAPLACVRALCAHLLACVRVSTSCGLKATASATTLPQLSSIAQMHLPCPGLDRLIASPAGGYEHRDMERDLWPHGQPQANEWQSWQPHWRRGLAWAGQRRGRRQQPGCSGLPAR